MMITLRNVGGFILLLIYICLFGELFLRFLAPQPIVPRYVTGTKWGIRGNIPGAQYVQITPETTAHISVNNQGFRSDHEYVIEKPARLCRIGFFGDSYFMGYEVNSQDMFVTQVQNLLAEKGFHVEVLNFAVSGFGTAEEVIALQKYGLTYEPDLIVFEWHQSDIEDNIRSALFKLNQTSKLEQWHETYLPAVDINDRLQNIASYQWLSDHSQFFNAVKEKTTVMIKQALAKYNRLRYHSDENPNANDKEFDQREAQNLSVALLKYANEISQAHNIPFLIFDIPIFSSRTDFVSSAVNLALPPELSERLVSPLKKFQSIANPETQLYFEKGHRHFTPKGNQVAASVLVERILNSESASFAGCKEK